jgi:hypothetical protein
MSDLASFTPFDPKCCSALPALRALRQEAPVTKIEALACTS